MLRMKSVRTGSVLSPYCLRRHPYSVHGVHTLSPPTRLRCGSPPILRGVYCTDTVRREYGLRVRIESTDHSWISLHHFVFAVSLDHTTSTMPTKRSSRPTKAKSSHICHTLVFWATTVCQLRSLSSGSSSCLPSPSPSIFFSSFSLFFKIF